MSKQKSRKCGPCSLCHQESTRYFHPQSWEQEKRCRYMSMLKLTAADNNSSHICICRACHHDLDQNSGKPGYVPRSIKLAKRDTTLQANVQRCNVINCTNQVDIKETHCINFEDTPPDIVLTVCADSVMPRLCASHYHRIYKYQHHNIAKCATCNEKPKSSEQFNRHCPNPTIIEKYLRANKGFSDTIDEDDVVCYRCYKQQSELIETLKLFGLHKQETSSIDSDLDRILFGVMHKMQESEQQSEEYALFSTILMVGSTIRKHNAVLLPIAHKHFLSLVKKTPMPTERSCRWLLGGLEKVIGHHITSKCVQKKHGTILTRTGGDLMHALSSALRSQVDVDIQSTDSTRTPPTERDNI